MHNLGLPSVAQESLRLVAQHAQPVSSRVPLSTRPISLNAGLLKFTHAAEGPLGGDGMHHGHGSGWLSPDSAKQASMPAHASEQKS